MNVIVAEWGGRVQAKKVVIPDSSFRASRLLRNDKSGLTS
jgi:hypothetical protein